MSAGLGEVRSAKPRASNRFARSCTQGGRSIGWTITVDPDTTPDQDSFTKGAGKFGVGFSYQIPRSKVRLYIEGAGWVYKWDHYGFDKTQFDTTWSGGISYRFGG